LPPGITAGPAPANGLQVVVGGTPTARGAYRATIKVTDSSKPVKSKTYDVPIIIGGARYHAAIQIKEPNSGNTISVLFDTGAPTTVVNLAAAITVKLLKPDGTDNGFAMGAVEYGGVAQSGFVANLSKPLTVLAKGRKADGVTDFNQNFVTRPDQHVVYPAKGQADPGVSLLGTDFTIKGFKAQEDGSLDLLAANFRTPNNPSGEVCPRVVQVSGSPPNFPLISGAQTVLGGTPFTVLNQSSALSTGTDVIGFVDLSSIKIRPRTRTRSPTDLLIPRTLGCSAWRRPRFPFRRLTLARMGSSEPPTTRRP
jgi:hypothetical protein